IRLHELATQFLRTYSRTHSSSFRSMARNHGGQPPCSQEPTKDSAKTAAEVDPGRRVVEAYSTMRPDIRSPTQTAPAEVAAATEASLATSYQTGAVDPSGAVIVPPARREKIGRASCREG